MSVQRAMEAAVRAHADQWREGEFPLPYSTHPIEVLILLRYVGGVTDEAMLCTAALHDTVEEGSMSFKAIADSFGGHVEVLVRALTRREPSAEETAGLSKDEIWKLRADMLLNEIGEMSPEAQTVKLADRLSNVRDAKRLKSGKKLNRYLWQTKRIIEIVPRSVNPGLWDAIKSEI